jgi:hypothetical protein
MLLRLYASKDTTVTDVAPHGVALSASNLGGSSILEVFKLSGSQGSAHALVQFDISTAVDMIGSGMLPWSSARCELVLSNARHDDTLPSSFDLEVVPVSESWDEGSGMDHDDLSDLGFANWERRAGSSYWSTFGGTETGTPVSFHLDTGHEDVRVDVRAAFEGWYSGSVQNNGFLVRLSSSLVSDDNDYYVKKFHGRTTPYLDKRPYIQISWDDAVRDDRLRFYYNTTSSLYLRYDVDGYPADIPSAAGGIGVRVFDASGTLLIVTGSHVSVGVYSASFALPSASYSGTTLNDVWFPLSAPASWLSSGTFVPLDRRATTTDVWAHGTRVVIPDLPPTNDVHDVVKTRVFLLPRSFAPARTQSASLPPTGRVVPRSYYSVVNRVTNDVVVPFDTGSFQSTRMSYDGEGHHFTMRMDTFAPGEAYVVHFLLEENGTRRVFVGPTFRVTGLLDG